MRRCEALIKIITTRVFVELLHQNEKQEFFKLIFLSSCVVVVEFNFVEFLHGDVEEKSLAWCG